MNKPIKRHESLKPLSRDHHHGLLLCWKIKMSKKFDISPQRVNDYLKYFYKSQLVAHFNIEEEHVFPILGEEDPLVRRALQEHKELRKRFVEMGKTREELHGLSKLLEQHIRFEERVLFNEIQDRVGEDELNRRLDLENEKSTTNPDDWEDKFWLQK